MIVQADGSYKASTTRGSTSEGKFYLQDASCDIARRERQEHGVGATSGRVTRAGEKRRDSSYVPPGRSLGLLIGGRLLASLVGSLITHLAERVPGRWRLTILQFRPIARLLIALAVTVLLVPVLVHPTFENVVALLAGLGLALAFALKDYGSSLVAGLVTVLEGPYQPGDWIEVAGAYGEVRSIGMRAVRIVTADDTEIVLGLGVKAAHATPAAPSGRPSPALDY